MKSVNENEHSERLKVYEYQPVRDSSKKRGRRQPRGRRVADADEDGLQDEAHQVIIENLCVNFARDQLTDNGSFKSLGAKSSPVTGRASSML